MLAKTAHQNPPPLSLSFSPLRDRTTHNSSKPAPKCTDVSITMTKDKKSKTAASTSAAPPSLPPPPPPALLAKAQAIHRLLDRLYPDPPIPLDHFDNYSLLIAVILSAQTTDGKVNEVTPGLFQAAPTPAHLAALPHATVLELIRSVGLAPGKTKNIIGAAKMLVEKFGGQVPSTFEELESLPGVGHKTASVVMSQAFNYAAFPVDTHVHRCALRWGLCKDTPDVKKVEAALKSLFPQEAWSRIGLQIIYFGREHCPAKKHVSASCPICCWVNGGKSRGSPPPALPPPRYSASGKAGGGKEGGMEGGMGEWLKQFEGTSPGKANKNIILYSERRKEEEEGGREGGGKASLTGLMGKEEEKEEEKKREGRKGGKTKKVVTAAMMVAVKKEEGGKEGGKKKRAAVEAVAKKEEETGEGRSGGKKRKTAASVMVEVKKEGGEERRKRTRSAK